MIFLYLYWFQIFKHQSLLRKNHPKEAILLLIYINDKTETVKGHNIIFVNIPKMTFSYKSIKRRSGVIHLGVVTVDVFRSFCSCWRALGALESKWIIAEIMLDSSTIFAAKTLHSSNKRVNRWIRTEALLAKSPDTKDSSVFAEPKWCSDSLFTASWTSVIRLRKIVSLKSDPLRLNTAKSKSQTLQIVIHSKD